MKKLENLTKKIELLETSKSELSDMLFAWKVLKHVKSNAIITVKDKMSAATRVYILRSIAKKNHGDSPTLSRRFNIL